ncbi:uncharacterized protein LOC119373399 [Rhipicephalus sanguineus]|uniref:uncharacterized protein LOC119373399 n=1 Tax=Rhipicephalus sanguineus TaxID=34632 RepID=UPI0018930AA1|nr:uncharacterized protein LOC119373399 [Rhipicephalus sanguineus]
MRLSTVAAIVIIVALVANEIGFAFKIKRLRIRRGPRRPPKPSRTRHSQHTHQHSASSTHGKNTGHHKPGKPPSNVAHGGAETHVGTGGKAPATGTRSGSTATGGNKPPAAGSHAGSTDTHVSGTSSNVDLPTNGGAAPTPPEVHRGGGGGGNVLVGLALGTEAFSSLAGAGTSIADTVLTNQANKADGEEDENEKDKRVSQPANRRAPTRALMR